MLNQVIGQYWNCIMKQKTQISPRYMALLFISVIFFSWMYYVMGTSFANSPLTYFEYLVFTSFVAVIVIGMYQIFFWVQRNNYFFKTRCFKIKLDDKIPFWPIWVWVYNFLYYVMIGYVITSINSIEQGVFLIFWSFVLLVLQCICFLVYPSTVPPKWRKYKADTLSTKFLKFVQGKDNGRNCMPSMHMSVATYVSLILLPVLSYWSFAFIGLIALSCLFVKQHQILDIIPGIFLGWLVYYLMMIV